MWIDFAEPNEAGEACAVLRGRTIATLSTENGMHRWLVFDQEGRAVCSGSLPVNLAPHLDQETTYKCFLEMKTEVFRLYVWNRPSVDKNPASGTPPAP